MYCRAAFLVTLLAVLVGLATRADDAPGLPGKTEKGFLLPNGWTITPAGKQLTLTDLPLNILPLTDGKRALVATSGFNKHQLSLVDLSVPKLLTQQTVRQSWYGLALSGDSRSAWWSGGGGDVLHTFDLKDDQLVRTSPAEPVPARRGGDAQERPAKPGGFRSGLLLDAPRGLLYSLDLNRGSLSALDVKSGQVTKTVPCGSRPYDLALSRNRAQLFVSDWAGRAVLVLDAETLRVVARIPVGEHPNQLAPHPTDDRLFVACASANCVCVIDTRRGVVTETVSTALFPRAPEGSTPDAVAVAPDGKTAYVANADNNCVAVMDVTVPGKSQVKGFIPTGWYPTAVAVTPDGKALLVGVGKGNQTHANPLYKDKEKGAEEPKEQGRDATGGRRLPFPYIGTTLSGALSVVPVPDERQLIDYTATVYRNCPYADELLTGRPHPVKTAIPTRVGDPSPIKYVIYIIKENRTYDQVLGDVKKGNGDPSLVMFGEKVTPNHHKLADEFVLFDNLYCNGQVSRDGHPWSTMAYNTDYIARDWHLTYSQRRGVSDTDEGELSNAPSGYLWDTCARAGLSYRSYGEYGKRVSTGDGAAKMEGRVPGLVGHVCPDYALGRRGAKMRDTDNVEVFLKEYRGFEESGQMPRFIVMSLGEDHTEGTRPGSFTPQACVASNDLALGRLVEAVSHGKYWKETAIFVIEDDAQNGPDHVDAHRTFGVVISPYTKRRHVDSTQYSTVSMVRTMELILGLSPLSQYDAAARPMYASFTDKADLTPYTHEKARIDLGEVNKATAYGAVRSKKMDFSEYDLADDFELNEILWRSIKGPDAPVPPTVRRAIANRPADVRK
jgi:YVTN family beta-propeller protein